MPLDVGARLGSYEIVGALGAGGMGEVYRARDTKLGRAVAIKVLPEALRTDPERISRFEREAKLLAALNHPNIAALHGMEEAGGRHFLVMELVEGETLADRLQRGALPLEEALRLAHQIAEALEAAHEKGVVHRDLKPANIKLTPDDKVKVLDFGLAKAMEAESAMASLTHSPTLSMAATQAGVILGTAAYMSPEQAKGLPADHRSDIFSFGAVLHEMLTGRQPFQGETAAEVMASVMIRETDLSGLPAGANLRLPELLKRCLEKNPKKRWQAIGDVRAELEAILAAPRLTPASAVAAAPLSARRRRLDRLIAAGVAAVITGVMAGVGAWMVKPEPARHVTRFALTLPEGQQFSGTGRHIVALSPDGRNVAYLASDRLNLRAMDQLETVVVRGTESARDPFFSPDGQWIGFYSAGQLKKVAVSGGAPVKLCDAMNPWGASWSEDDTILFGQGPQGIWRVSGQGGTPETVIAVDSGQSAHGPQALPGGNAILFTLATGAVWDDAQIVVQSVKTGERKVLIQGGRDGRYVPTGHLVYARGGTLLAVPFDIGRLEVTAGPVPLIEGVRDAGSVTGAAYFSLSDNGALVYVPGAAGDADRTLVWVDRQGREEAVPAPARPYSWVRVSPDGTRVAMEVQDPANTDIWIYDLARGTSTRLTFAAGPDRWPLWTPDGQRIVFASALDLVWKAADGTGEVEKLATGLALAPRPFTWSRDGKTLVYDQDAAEGDTLLLALKGDGQPQALITNEFRNHRPAVSPDGRWIAYLSNESGREEIYVRPFPAVGSGRWQISTQGGTSPVWSPRGRELFYNNGNAIMRVPIEAATSFSAGTPEVLFQEAYFWGVASFGRSYDIAPDGRFLMVKGTGTTRTPAAQIVVVENWFEELEARVPIQ